MRAHERTMLIVSMANGLSTLLLYALQRPALYQWVRLCPCALTGTAA